MYQGWTEYQHRLHAMFHVGRERGHVGIVSHIDSFLYFCLPVLAR